MTEMQQLLKEFSVNIKKKNTRSEGVAKSFFNSLLPVTLRLSIMVCQTMKFQAENYLELFSDFFSSASQILNIETIHPVMGFHDNCPVIVKYP